MKKISFILAGVLSLAILPSAQALSLKFVNQSKWEIHELYFSPSDEKSWGPDQLGDDVIEHGQTFTLSKIAKGTYDVNIVDEDGDACVVEDVDFASSESFTLTEKLLLGCQQATAEESEESEEEYGDKG